MILGNDPCSLPVDAMDFIAKSTAWLNQLIENDRADLRQQLVRHGERLLEKYDFPANRALCDCDRSGIVHELIPETCPDCGLPNPKNNPFCFCKPEGFDS